MEYSNSLQRETLTFIPCGLCAGFISHLYKALRRKHNPTYIDNLIEKGDEVWAELVKAMKQSTLFLVVFSENYASSTWCLNELVQIMECHKNDQVVNPVFYHVDPSDVRKHTGSYGTALAKHKKEDKCTIQRWKNARTIQKWKNALFEAANLSGFHNTTYRYY
ncbi:disease resistance protein RLM3 [Medicago truncatula]|uniref:Disease resistance protein (TIR-NBS-LRR class) n=1 Tax=Medicago truncatula TaxID=3880 RepID=G7ZVF7_MEDTR|nr:disease resistance protein RLM3 [Medicago truncatula]KEH18362.1 disease resistance protein (TIR-NBS-LRR class) [Medicago truncatula]